MFRCWHAVCDHAKILAACDVFCAATSPRAYHQAKLPYTIMEEIIRSAADGIFNKAIVKALVQAAGLFPVGSHVVLSNQRIGKVMACNPARLDRPVVEIFDYDGTPTGKQIDLATLRPEQLSIIRASCAPEYLKYAG